MANIESSDLNKLVMNYLINEGYQNAARNFAREAGIELNDDRSAMEDRVHIRNDIYMGNIQSAIERINNLHPQVRTLLLLLPPIAPAPVPLL